MRAAGGKFWDKQSQASFASVFDDIGGGLDRVQAAQPQNKEIDAMQREHYLGRLLVRNRFSLAALELMMTEEHQMDWKNSISHNIRRVADKLSQSRVVANNFFGGNASGCETLH